MKRLDEIDFLAIMFIIMFALSILGVIKVVDLSRYLFDYLFTERF